MHLNYIFTRVGAFFLVVFVAVTVNFIVPRLAPGDPVTQRLEAMANQGTALGGDFTKLVEAYKAKFGYDKPLWQQYLSYWGDIFRGDLGYSISRYPARVWEIIKKALPWTIGMLGTATLLAFTVGTLAGALLAWPTTPAALTKAFIPLLIIFSAIPYYLLGLLLLFLFSLTWNILPSGGGHSIFVQPGWNWPSFVDLLKHALLPALSKVIASVAFWALGMRGMMVTVQGEDYMTLAEAKGLSRTRLFFRYGMRNAFLPQATHLAMAMGHVVSGAVLVEVIFRYPGIGYALYEAISGKDFFVMQGILLLLILSIALTLMIMDFIYPLLDPRVSYGRQN
ncbi:MAG: ABC transporter permease [Caldilineaceae bacterium]|nr:ABC transporter permease [Caldilineaceae bacterium]